MKYAGIMEKEIANTNEMDIWSKEKRDIVRKTFAPNLNQAEFAMFVGLGKSLGANPFMREIWAVKYGNKEAQIFLGRDFYRRKAQEQPNYGGHHVDVVYSNDDFKMENGQIHHSYELTDRGNIIGAYCNVHVEDREPFFVFAEFDEYFNGNNKYDNTWDKKPATMIKKVAEAQALRGAFQGVFAGTYDVSEQWRQEAAKPKLEGKELDMAIDSLSKGLISNDRLNELYEIDQETQQIITEETGEVLAEDTNAES